MNGTLYLSSNPYGFYNSTNPQTETDPLAYNGTLMFVSDWNATNTSYYLESNPYNFYNSTNPSPVINTSYYVDNTHGYYNSTNPQTVSDIWVNVSGDLMTGRLNISDELSIIGNYPLKWFDNTGVTQYAYMIANSGEFLFSALDVPMDFKYGNLGSNLGARMNTSGNWNFTQNLNVVENITADYFLGDGSFLTGIDTTETLWNANYSEFLTHINWGDVINGTLAFNSSLSNYYLSSNLYNFYNLTDFDITDYSTTAEANALYYNGTGNISLLYGNITSGLNSDGEEAIIITSTESIDFDFPANGYVNFRVGGDTPFVVYGNGDMVLMEILTLVKIYCI